jgi:ankyrin repeat protein
MTLARPFSNLDDLKRHFSENVLQFSGVDLSDINVKGFLGSPLLQVVAEQEVHEDIYIPEVKLLIDNGANVNCTGEMGETPLHSAAYRNREKLAALLLRSGARSDIKDEYGLTPADIASVEGYFKLAQLLQRP